MFYSSAFLTTTSCTSKHSTTSPGLIFLLLRVSGVPLTETYPSLTRYLASPPLAEIFSRFKSLKSSIYSVKRVTLCCSVILCGNCKGSSYSVRKFKRMEDLSGINCRYTVFDFFSISLEACTDSVCLYLSDRYMISRIPD